MRTHTNRFTSAGRTRSAAPGSLLRSGFGFTLIDLIIVIAILATILTIAVPMGMTALDNARTIRAISELRTLQNELAVYEQRNGDFPETLDEIGRADRLDPWRHPYQYLKIQGNKVAGGKGGKGGKGGEGGGSIMGSVRKDRFLVPLNADYDLYSMGKDGKSKPPLQAAASHDDIIRANSGDYLGLASEY